MSKRGPPGLATRLTARMLPLSEREDTLGDLNERFCRKAEASGTASARAMPSITLSE